ncbi:MAG TPA: alpha/beta hydrolase [Rhodocyclaceae bacterium]|nr:alpha/beta hydrolase [Rhodocyclaceae bacterium]
MAYVEWGDPDNDRVLLCVHGLTRNGRDFDVLASTLAGDYRVVCPDVAGRGHSDRLANPVRYGVPQYVADMVTLIARLGVEQVDWLGTSMGGLIGMALAALPGAPIRKLVLNDVGPLVTATALRRIGSYVGRGERFPDLAAAEAYLRRIHAPFGALSDSQWRHLAEYSFRHEGHDYVFAYDPAIGNALRDPAALVDINLWPVYDAIRATTLVVRGAESDLLTAETLKEMATRGPRAQTLEIPGVGHAPTFMSPDQIGPLRNFLLAG